MANVKETIENYIKEAPEKRRAAMIRLRELCQEYLPDHTESMRYNMPSFERNEQVQVAFASQSQYISVYFLIHEVMLNSKPMLEGLNTGKGCIRYRNPDKIDFDLIVHLLKETAKSEDTIC